MKKFSIIIFSIVFFTACVSEQKQKAAEIIANTWQAESAIIGHSYGKDTKTNQIELTLTNLKGVDADYSPKKNNFSFCHDAISKFKSERI